MRVEAKEEEAMRDEAEGEVVSLPLLIYTIPKIAEVVEPKIRGVQQNWCAARYLDQIKRPGMYRPVLVRSRSLAPDVKKTFVATLKGHPEGGLKIVLEFPAGFENPEDARDVIWDTIMKLMKIPNADDESVTDFAPVFFETDSSKAVTSQSKRLFLDLLLKKAKFGADNNVLICLPPVVDGKARNTGLFYVNLYYPGAPPKEIYLLGAGEHNHEKSEEKSTYTVFSFSRDVVVGSKRLKSAAEPDSSDARYDRSRLTYNPFDLVHDQATFRKAIQSLRDMIEENADMLYGKTEEKHYEFDGNVSYAKVNDNDIPAGALAVQLRLNEPPQTQTAGTLDVKLRPDEPPPAGDAKTQTAAALAVRLRLDDPSPGDIMQDIRAKMKSHPGSKRTRRTRLQDRNPVQFRLKRSKISLDKL